MLIFSEAVRKACPLKSDQAIQELLAAAHSELESNGERIAYQTLFTEVSSKILDEYFWQKTLNIEQYA